MNRFIAPFLVALSILLLAGCAHQQPESAADVSITQSPNDERQYEYLVLPNELRVVLISDAEADKGAASLTVGVGSTAHAVHGHHQISRGG